MISFPKFRLALKRSSGLSLDNLGTNKIGDQLELTATHALRPTGGDPQTTVVKPHDYFVQTGTTLADALVADNQKAVVDSFEATLDNVSYQANLTDSTQSMTRPQNAETELDPAMDSVTESWPAMVDLVRQAVQGHSLPDLQARWLYIKYLRALRDKVQVFSVSLDNTLALAENDLCKRLRSIYDAGQSTFKSSQRLQKVTAALVSLFTKSGQDAADQRKNNQGVATNTEAKLHGEQQTPPPATAAAGTSAAPPQGQGTVAIPVAQTTEPASTSGRKAARSGKRKTKS